VALIPDRIAPIIGLATHLGRGMQRIATDGIVGRVRSFPRTIADLDASYTRTWHR
jgi:hypothetical protein